MSTAMKRVVRQTTRETRDKHTGELEQISSEKVSYLPTEPPYVKLYLEDIAKLHGLTKSNSEVMHALFTKMDYEGIITLVSSSKQRIADSLGIRVQTINNTLQSLLKSDIIRRVGRGEFMFNPSIIAKGDWQSILKNRDKYIQLNVTYSADNERHISAEIKDVKEA